MMHFLRLSAARHTSPFIHALHIIIRKYIPIVKQILSVIYYFYKFFSGGSYGI